MLRSSALCVTDRTAQGTAVALPNPCQELTEDLPQSPQKHPKSPHTSYLKSLILRFHKRMALVYTIATCGGKWGEMGQIGSKTQEKPPQGGAFRTVVLYSTSSNGLLTLLCRLLVPAAIPTMFLGEFTHTIDDKGRLTIPAKFRGELAKGLVVTRGFDQNLMVFPIKGWEELAEEISQRPLSDSSARAFRRRVFSGAVDLTPDRQGRILLPTHLREFAGLNGEAVIAGMYNYLEIWSEDGWGPVREEIENSDDVERWEDLGI